MMPTIGAEPSVTPRMLGAPPNAYTSPFADDNQ
jgi:hypothetical protein